MIVARGLDHYQSRSYPVLAIGNFDGLHRGHVALLRQVVATAAEHGGTPTVLTFDPHPITVLAPGTPLRLLTNQNDKLTGFEAVGIQQVLVLAFDKSFASLTPEEFVFKILRDAMAIREVFVGEHFAFGAKRSGRLADLTALSARAGFRVQPVPPFLVHGDIVSSTRIRSLLQAGDVAGAARFLGRHYQLEGVVVRGEGRGQDLGWPTANLHLPAHRAIPADGVYAALTVWSGRVVESVAYIGTRPTFGSGERLLEVSLLDSEVSLYGESIAVRFVDRVRDDAVFRTAEELSARIDLDVVRARESLKDAMMQFGEERPA
jgi:riboflavin kinase / FMN adenylyltransferase